MIRKHKSGGPGTTKDRPSLYFDEREALCCCWSAGTRCTSAPSLILCLHADQNRTSNSQRYRVFIPWCTVTIYFQMRPLFSIATVLAIIFCSVSSLKFRVKPTIHRSLQATVGSANLDWPNLGFEYSATESFVKCEYKNGEWGEVKLESDPYVKIHIGATALHYGQACFEGMKAFHTENGKVCIFRPTENADRIARSSRRVCMPPLPEEKFIDAMKLVVRENLAYVPVRQSTISSIGETTRSR